MHLICMTCWQWMANVSTHLPWEFESKMLYGWCGGYWSICRNLHRTVGIVDMLSGSFWPLNFNSPRQTSFSWAFPYSYNFSSISNPVASLAFTPRDFDDFMGEAQLLRDQRPFRVRRQPETDGVVSRWRSLAIYSRWIGRNYPPRWHLMATLSTKVRLSMTDSPACYTENGWNTLQKWSNMNLWSYIRHVYIYI